MSAYNFHCNTLHGKQIFPHYSPSIGLGITTTLQAEGLGCVSQSHSFISEAQTEAANVPYTQWKLGGR